MRRHVWGILFWIWVACYGSAWWLFAQQPELLPPPVPAAEIDICGHYALEGATASGKGYTGTVLIAKVKGNYAVTWLLETGGICRGVGLREGDTLTVGAVQNDDVVAFRFTIGGAAGKPKLAGRYAMNGIQGTETLTLLRRPSL